jgi:hypothetical protein
LIVQGEAVIPRRGKYAGLKIFQRFHFSWALKLINNSLTDYSGRGRVPRRGKCADLKIFLRIHFYSVLKPVN